MDLTLFLCLATGIESIDDEVADFTHKDGWQKLDKVLSLIYHRFGWLFRYWSKWIGWLHRSAENLTVCDLTFF